MRETPKIVQASPRYRKEIDGLRAIAVVSVILYHAQFTFFGNDWVEGGFIGVDIFFVISGYLISRLILTELEIFGTCNLKRFYERRARRILPVLIVVIAASLPIAWQRLLPEALIEYAWSALTSLLLISNFFFYFNTTAYGADSSLLKPLLHTWSLGVEEQFYIVFPVLVLLLHRYGRKYFFKVLGAIGVASLLFAQISTTQFSELNFYLPFSRFWEFLVGTVLALREVYCAPVEDSKAKRSLPVFGLFFIVFSICFFDTPTHHPSLYTLFPVFGAALIVGFSSSDDFVGRLLAIKPLVWIGLISYSAYLWHYPVFAFARLGTTSLENNQKILLVFGIIFLSTMTYFLIEKPFRRGVNNWQFWTATSASVVLIVTFSGYVISSAGAPTFERLGFNVALLETAKRPSQYFHEDGSNTCKVEIDQIAGVNWCLLGQKAESNYEIAVIGDSHSLSSTETIHNILMTNGASGLYFGTDGCPPLLDFYSIRRRPHPSLQAELCQNHIQAAVTLAKNRMINSIVLIARWDYYVDGSDTGNWQSVTGKDFVTLNKEKARIEYGNAIERTFSAFSSEGVNLLVLLQVPHQQVNPKRIFEDLIAKKNATHRHEHLEKNNMAFISAHDHQQRQQTANDPWLKLLTEAHGTSHFTLIDPTTVFCDGTVCPIHDGGTSFYYDDNHASTKGFDRLRKTLEAAIF